MKTAIFDIDGTLANIKHRLRHIQGERKDWEAFHEACMGDEPYFKVIEMTRILRDAGYKIIMCTGRPEIIREQTMEWLNNYLIPCEMLVMRAKENYESDFIIKDRMVEMLIDSGHDIHYVFEDRDRVVDMFRSKGVTTFQVKKGDY